jgi:hypothetical protein
MTFGLTVTEATRSGVNTTPTNRFRQIIVIGTSSTATAANHNVLVQLRDLRFFETTFGTTSPSYRTIQYLFSQDLNANIQFMCGKDPAATPTQLQNLQWGIGRLVALQNLESSILLCAEGIVLASQTDRTAVYTTLEALASGARRKHINYWNLSEASNTKALALTERALFSSSLGTSVCCYEYIEMSTGVFVPVAVHQAGFHLKLSRTNPFDPPSGSRSVMVGVRGIRNNNFISLDADWNDFSNNNINVPVQLPDGSFCIWGAKNLNMDSNIVSINSRTSFIITSNVLRDAAMPFLQESSDRNGATARGCERALLTALENLYNLGAYTSDNDDVSTAYRVVMVPITTNSKKAIRFDVFVRLIDTLETIQINLLSVLLIPS